MAAVLYGSEGEVGVRLRWRRNMYNIWSLLSQQLLEAGIGSTHAVPKTKLLSHQRLGVASSNEGYIGQFLDFGDMIFSGFAASHDSNSECHLGAFGRAKSNSSVACRRLRGIPKSMAVSGPLGYFFSTPATGKPPAEITHQKSRSHDKHQGYSDSDVKR